MDNEQLLQALSDMIDKKLDVKLEPICSRLDRMDERLDKMDERFDRIDSQIAALRSGQIALRKEIKEIDIKVSDTYDLALDAWGKSTENRTWLEKSKLTI